MVTSASARDRFYRTVERALGAEAADFLLGHLPELDMSDVATKSDLRVAMAELRQDMAEMRQQMATKGDLRDVERRVTEHIDLRVDARLASNMRSTLAWSVAMNATMLGAVIAAIRL
jgi:hypothetical protein